MFKNILIPTDGSELSEKVARDGVSLAKLLNARITGVHVVRLLYVAATGVDYGLFDPNLQLRIQEAAREDGKRYLDQMEAVAGAAGVPFERVLVENEQPWKGILDTAREHRCDLVMMAAHGRRGVVALLLGSETNKVLTHSKVPVLVYR